MRFSGKQGLLAKVAYLLLFHNEYRDNTYSITIGKGIQNRGFNESIFKWILDGLM